MPLSNEPSRLRRLGLISALTVAAKIERAI
jgi:hypothetical protein